MSEWENSGFEDDYQTGDDFSVGGTWLEQPGNYHMIVSDLKVPAESFSGKLIQGSAFGATLSVLDGTTDSEKGKTINCVWFRPRGDMRDGGKFARKKIDRFLIATGLIGQEDKNKGVKLSELLPLAVGRQICCKIDSKEDSSGKERLDIAFADIFHPYDPKVESWPKNRAVLAMMSDEQKSRSPAKPKQPEVPPTKNVDEIDI